MGDLSPILTGLLLGAATGVFVATGSIAITDMKDGEVTKFGDAAKQVGKSTLIENNAGAAGGCVQEKVSWQSEWAAWWRGL